MPLNYIIRDDVLSAAVRNRLRTELILTHQIVRATVAGGVVTVRGKLENAGRREAAKVVAESARGLRKVLAEISIVRHLGRRPGPRANDLQWGASRFS